MLTWLVVPMHHRPSFAAEKDTTRGFLFSELSDFQPSKSHHSEVCNHCREPCPRSLQMLSEKMMALCNLA